MEIVAVYDDGSVLSNDVISITPDDICKKFSSAVNNISALSLELGIPTKCAVPHMIANAFKNVASVSLEIDYKLDALENLSSTGPAQEVGGDKKADAPA